MTQIDSIQKQNKKLKDNAKNVKIELYYLVTKYSFTLSENQKLTIAHSYLLSRHSAKLDAIVS